MTKTIQQQLTCSETSRMREQEFCKKGFITRVFLALAFILTGTMQVCADEVTIFDAAASGWSASGVNLTSGETTVGGATWYGGSSASLDNGFTVGNVTWGKRIKFGGKSTVKTGALSRVLKFTVTSAGTVYVYAITGSSNADRYVYITQELTSSDKGGTVLGSGNTNPASVVSGEVEAGDVYIYADDNIGVAGITFEALTSDPVDPAATFSSSSYTIGGSSLDLSKLFSSNSKGSVTYSVKDANGTGATTDGTTFTATTAGTATITASQAATLRYNACSVDATITVTEPEQIGSSSTAYNTVFTGKQTISAGKTRHITFHNEGTADANYKNWILVANKSGESATIGTSSQTYTALRADCWDIMHKTLGTDNTERAINCVDNTGSAVDVWTNFASDMTDADVDLYITFSGTRFYLKAVTKTSANRTYTYTAETPALSSAVESADLYLSCEMATLSNIIFDYETEAYTVTAETDGNGTVALTNGNGMPVSSGTAVQSGESITYTATGNSGYEFSKWSDGKNTNPYQRTITTSTSLTAKFSVLQCATPTITCTDMTVTITSTEGSTIYYTTDGTEPTTSSTQYSSAFTIDKYYTIKAFAVKDGYTDSEIASKDTRKTLTLAYDAESYTYGTSTTLPSLSAKDGDTDVKSSLTIAYYSDDSSIATVNAKGEVTYAGGVGTAKIKAVVSGNETYQDAMATYSYSYSAGYNNIVAKDKTPKVNETIEVKNGNNLLLTVKFGGYKYNASGTYTKDSWKKATTYTGAGGKTIYYIDSYQNQSSGSQDPRSEKEYNGKAWSTADQAGSIEWYSTSETKPTGGNYSQYERIKPFSLPCVGAYMKFEPEVSGILTAYVLQNGNINFKDEGTNTVYSVSEDNERPLATQPRVYYWFNQDGWCIKPTAAIVKQPVTVGIDRGASLDADGNYVYGDIATELSAWVYGTDGTGKGEYYDLETLRSQWPTTAQVTENLAFVSPNAQPIIDYRGGKLIVQKAYVKYEIPVVAGNSYYFFSNNSKLGYAGCNFRPYTNGAATMSTPNGSGTVTVSNVTTAKSLNQTADEASTWNPGTGAVKTYNQVTFARTFKQNTWNTICLPFPLTEAQVEKVFGYGTKLLIYNGVTDRTAMFLMHVDQNILAGQPYLIKPTGVDSGGNTLSTVSDDGKIGGNGGLTFTNVNVDSNLGVKSYGDNGDGGYEFIGTLAPTDVKPYEYYINASTGKLTQYIGKSNTTLNTYRAYLHISDSSQSEAKAITGIGFGNSVEMDDDDTTGIIEILVNDMGVDIQPLSGVFNLNGQKVATSTANLPAGIYIVNGKKITLK